MALYSRINTKIFVNANGEGQILKFNGSNWVEVKRDQTAITLKIVLVK